MHAQYCIHCATLRGVEAVPVMVEVLVGSGLPSFSIVGMPDAAIQEARERVRAAIRSCGFTMPNEKVVVNLAPGSLKKVGSGFDLPIALGILVATGQIAKRTLDRCLCVGELSLEGHVRPVQGLLAFELCAQRQGLDMVCAQPPDGLVGVDAVECMTVKTLGDFERGLYSKGALREWRKEESPVDFSEIMGHEAAKRALQIAAAGRHGVLMMGPPGSGKTMLASRLPTILPPLTEQEKIEAAVVHSVAGEDITPILAGVRPFRSPHHSTSMAGLVGGGSPPHPGEISLATGGVLFLDELTEFKPSVLQAIRQPLESGTITVTRAEGNVTFPASFMLVGATNPCPCGYFGDSELGCSCTAPQIKTYQNRIGGPLMDRIDIHIDVWRTPPAQVLKVGSGISSTKMMDGVMIAKEFSRMRRLRDRFGDASSSVIRSCALDETEEEFMQDMARLHHMSGRGIIRTLSIARTIADLDEREVVGREHLCEALGLRLRDGVGVL